MGRATRGLAHFRIHLRRSSHHGDAADCEHPWAVYAELGQQDLNDISAETMRYL